MSRNASEVLAELTGWDIWQLLDAANATVTNLQQVSTWAGDVACLVGWVDQRAGCGRGRAPQRLEASRAPPLPPLPAALSHAPNTSNLALTNCCPRHRPNHPKQASGVLVGAASNSSLATLPDNLAVIAGDLAGVASNVRWVGRWVGGEGLL